MIFLSNEFVYKHIKEYIESLIYYLRSNGINSEFLILNQQNISKINDITNCIIIHVQCIQIKYPTINNNKEYLLNIEQFKELDYRNFSIKTLLFTPNLPIIDFSSENIKLIKDANSTIKTYFFPYIYNPYEAIFQYEHTHEYDVGIIGGSEHRSIMINNLRVNNITVNHILKFGEERDREICKCKILLNIHYLAETNILESIRCYPILYKRIPIISESSIFNPEIPLNNLIIYEKYETIVSKVKEVLNNYDFYKKKLDSFDFINQNKEFENHLKIFLNNEKF